jgi:glycosyltransferase involved in cell wall biosynthesis
MTAALGISCVIPVHNGEKHLAEAIESVLRQTEPALEIIVVDDGSTDRSAEVARDFGQRIRYERQDHRGVSAARNNGIRMAKGDLICLLDADDIFMACKHEVQAERFRMRPELEFCAALTENFWSPELPADERDHESVMLEAWPRHLSTWLFRMSLFERIGGFDEQMRLSQDVDWLLRATVGEAICETVPLILSRRRLHHLNNTRFAREECRAALLESVNRHFLSGKRAAAKRSQS